MQIAYSNTFLVGAIKTELLGHYNLSKCVVTELTAGCHFPLPSIVGLWELCRTFIIDP